MMKKLNENDLLAVTGGFQELNKALPTAGKDIICPKCGEKAGEQFAKSVLYDPSLGSVEYHCSCGCQFVCYNDEVSYKDEFVKLCGQNGIEYKFL